MCPLHCECVVALAPILCVSAAVHEAGFGTKRMSAWRGKAHNICDAFAAARALGTKRT
jgi:hypothetical protein